LAKIKIIYLKKQYLSAVISIGVSKLNCDLWQLFGDINSIYTASKHAPNALKIEQILWLNGKNMSAAYHFSITQFRHPNLSVRYSTLRALLT